MDEADLEATISEPEYFEKHFIWNSVFGQKTIELMLAAGISAGQIGRHRFFT